VASWSMAAMCQQATSLPFIRSPCQRSQAILTEILGRMSWRSCSRRFSLSVPFWLPWTIVHLQRRGS
jgi:hypothetical protein